MVYNRHNNQSLRGFQSMQSTLQGLYTMHQPNKRENQITSPSPVIKIVDNNEMKQYLAKIDKNCKLQETIVIPRRKKYFSRPILALNNSMGFNANTDFNFNRNSNNNLSNTDEFKNIMELVYNNLTPTLKEVFKKVGVNIYAAVKSAISIPDYQNALKYSDKALDEFKASRDFNKFKSRRGLTNVIIDDDLVYKRKKELEKFLKFANQDGEYEEYKSKADELNRIHEYNMAKDFKDVNNLHLKSNLMQLGISSIRIAGDVCLITYDDKVGKVLKVSGQSSDAILQVYDKYKKVSIYMTEDEKRSGIPLKELVNVKDIMSRRNSLINEKLEHLMQMSEVLKNPVNIENEDRVRTAEYIIRATHTTPYKVEERLEKPYELRDLYKGSLDRLYRF